MSIFKDAKDDLEQSVNEMESSNSEAYSVDDIDLDLISNILEDENTDAKKTEVKKKKTVKEKTETGVSSAAGTSDGFDGNDISVPRYMASKESSSEQNAVTVITKGTTINGSIISDCSLDVMGTINGDIECHGKLTITGKVCGDSTASEVYVNTERLEGSITSDGSVKIGLGTIVVGDISAASAVFAGAIKGEIDVRGPVILDSTAIIKGNIKAKSVQMNNGAVLDGYCSLTYADLTIDSVFE